jgi:hypothetical protein
MRWPALLLLVFAAPCWGQTNTGNAQTSGPCSPAVSGNNNRIYLNCAGKIPKKARTSDAFNISDGITSTINVTQSLATKGSGNWWVTYISYLGNTASPVALAQYVEITNNQSVPETIKTYEVSMNIADCGWLDLSPIPGRDVLVWWTFEGLDNAIQMDFSKDALDYLLVDPIPPFHTVMGWWFFDSATKCGAREGDKVSYRITLTTFSGIKYTYTTPEFTISNKVPPRTNKGRLTGPETRPVRRGDISMYPRRLYGSPVP